MNISDRIKEKFNQSDWNQYKFSDFAENIVEKVVPRESGLEHYIGLEHLDSRSLIINRFGDPQSLKGDKLKIYKGDVIFAKRNAYLKRASLAEFDAIASAHSMVLRAKPEIILNDFLPFFMQSDAFWDIAIKISVGGLSPTINWRNLAKQEFLLPPIDQQAHIAELLWAMDEDLQSKKETLNRFDIFKRTYLNSLFLGAEYYSEEKNRIALNEYCDKITYGFTNPMPTTEEGILMVTATNVRNGKIDVDNTRRTSADAYNKLITNKSRPIEGDILLTKDGRLAELAIVGKEKICVNQSVAVLRPNETVLSEYLYYLLQIPYYHNLMLGQAGGTTIKHIYITKLAKMKVPVPSIEKQQELVDKASLIFQKEDMIESSITASKSLQKSLINQVF